MRTISGCDRRRDFGCNCGCMRIDSADCVDDSGTLTGPAFAGAGASGGEKWRVNGGDGWRCMRRSDKRTRPFAGTRITGIERSNLELGEEKERVSRIFLPPMNRMLEGGMIGGAEVWNSTIYFTYSEVVENNEERRKR